MEQFCTDVNDLIAAGDSCQVTAGLALAAANLPGISQDRHDVSLCPVRLLLVVVGLIVIQPKQATCLVEACS